MGYEKGDVDWRRAKELKTASQVAKAILAKHLRQSRENSGGVWTRTDETEVAALVDYVALAGAQAAFQTMLDALQRSLPLAHFLQHRQDEPK